MLPGCLVMCGIQREVENKLKKNYKHVFLHLLLENSNGFLVTSRKFHYSGPGSTIDGWTPRLCHIIVLSHKLCITGKFDKTIIA